MTLGIKIYGILSVLFSIYMVSYVVVCTDNFRELNLVYFTYFITALCWLFFGIGVFKLLPWARIGLIMMAIIYFTDLLESSAEVLSAIKSKNIGYAAGWGSGLIFFVSIIIYFNIPKVKKHFKKKSDVF